jgi:hypothetical protein
MVDGRLRIQEAVLRLASGFFRNRADEKKKIGETQNRQEGSNRGGAEDAEGARKKGVGAGGGGTAAYFAKASKAGKTPRTPSGDGWC